MGLSREKGKRRVTRHAKSDKGTIINLLGSGGYPYMEKITGTMESSLPDRTVAKRAYFFQPSRQNPDLLAFSSKKGGV